MNRRLIVARGAFYAALLGAAAAARAAPHAVPAVATVVIDHMTFSPQVITLKPGQTVEWVNRDMFEHSATARDGSFDLDMKPGASKRITVSKLGMIAYACRFHPTMGGTVRVAK